MHLKCVKLFFFFFKQVNLIRPVLKLSTHSCSAFQYWLQNTPFSCKVAHGKKKSVNVPVEWQLKLSELSRCLHFWQREAETTARNALLGDLNLYVGLRAPLSTAFVLINWKWKIPYFLWAAWVWKGRRISQLEFGQMLYKAEYKTNRT